MTVAELIEALEREPQFLHVYIVRRRVDRRTQTIDVEYQHVRCVTLEGPYVELCLEKEI